MANHNVAIVATVAVAIVAVAVAVIRADTHTAGADGVQENSTGRPASISTSRDGTRKGRPTRRQPLQAENTHRAPNHWTKG
jgi:hypothetical protein